MEGFILKVNFNNDSEGFLNIIITTQEFINLGYSYNQANHIIQRIISIFTPKIGPHLILY